MFYVCCFVFFFKQKTAYELRISDWSSDVCSSDLAGSEVSALLGRIPSAVGYQPTLGTDMGNLQERITTTTKGSITSVQAIYVPADDLTDPAPATAFSHLDATTVLSRQIAELGIYPAVDPLDKSEEHTSELQSLMRISYAVFCLKKKHKSNTQVKITNYT